MKSFLNFHAKRTQVTIALICIVMGFFLVTQIRGTQSYNQRLSEQSEQDLGQIVKDLTYETETLRSEVTDARIRLYKYEGETASRKTILNEAAQNLENLRILAGLTPVQGEGVSIVVSDKRHILNGTDLLGVIEELRAGGAEAIALNNKRLVTGSAFERRKKSIYLNSTKLSSPYRIKAIGDSEVLYQAITLPGGIRDALSSLEGVSLVIKRSDNQEIPALENKSVNEYAKAAKESE
jgi:uncharacterized protein YlxW (UPF0749 family)